MSDLIVVAYRQAEAAFAAAEALARLQRKAGVEPEDVVVVTRDDPDTVSVHHLIDRATGGPLAGGEWGMILGMLFLTQAGKPRTETGLAQSFREAGVDPTFLTKAAKSLTRGGGVVGLRRLLLDQALIADLVARQPGTGALLRGRLSPETEERLLDLAEQIPPDVLAHVNSYG